MTGSVPRPLSLRLALVAVLALAGGCDGASSVPDGPRLAALFTGRVDLVDLTHTLSASSPYWPGPETSPFRHDTLRAHPDGAPSMAAFFVPEHFGTHLDAPVHSAQGQPSVDRIRTERLFAPAVVIDVTDAVDDDPDYAVVVADLTGWETRHGRIPRGSVVLARTGWADRWPDADAYFGADTAGVLHFPGFSPAAARFLVEERTVVGIGIDSGSVDPGIATGFPVHGLMNGAGLYHLENLADLSVLPEAGAWVVVAPVKIEGGSGAPARVFAVLP